MAYAITRSCLKLKSNPYKRRVGLYPMLVALGISWAFVAIWLAVATWVFYYNAMYSILIGASATLFGVFLWLMSYRIYADSFREFELEVNDSEAVLLTKDNLKHKSSTQMVLLDDVKYAEYYPFRDSASIVLHAPYIDMDIPLWPMENEGHDLVDFLDGRGVRVINVQSDEKFPD